MTSPFATYPTPERSFMTSSFSARGTAMTPSRGSGVKRGRKAKTAGQNATPSVSPTSTQSTSIQWAAIQSTANAAVGPSAVVSGQSQPASAVASPIVSTIDTSQQAQLGSESGSVISLSAAAPAPQGIAVEPSPSARASVAPGGPPGPEEEGEGEDELLPAMADDDYSAQLSWQSQSKDNLK